MGTWTRGMRVRGVVYRGPNGVSGEVFITGRPSIREPVYAPDEVHRVLGPHVMRFEDIAEATQFLVDHRSIMEQLTVI
jgi:hypothetical protein